MAVQLADRDATGRWLRLIARKTESSGKCSGAATAGGCGADIRASVVCASAVRTRRRRLRSVTAVERAAAHTASPIVFCFGLLPMRRRWSAA